MIIETTGGYPKLLELPGYLEGPVLLGTDGQVFVEHPDELKSGRRIPVRRLHGKFPEALPTVVQNGYLVLLGVLRPKTSLEVFGSFH